MNQFYYMRIKEINIFINYRFSLKQSNILDQLKKFLNFIKISYNKKCRPLNSLPMIYKFDNNLILDDITKKLDKLNYSIISQLMNYDGKVIGVEVLKDDKIVYVPTFPSAPIWDKFPLKWIDSYEGISYLETKVLLEDIYKKSDKLIPCLPVIKVIEDNLIIGIITKTNQFILVNPPEIDTFGDDLEIINSSNNNLIDKNIMSNKIDKKRLEYVKKIKMESDFYINFRNTVRLELGNYKNKKYRLEIELILNNKELTYFNKLKRVETLLKKLLKNLVKFIEIENILLQNIEDITMCNKLSSDKCDENVFCLTEDDTCKLLIPSINLINEENNERLYFGRLSDELVRYNRIRAFILEPKVFLNFSNIKYNLLDSEIILLESLIKEYFTDLIIETDNKYINFNTYDTAEPQKSQTYSNIIIKENIEDNEKEKDCKIIESKISDSKGNKWRNIFPRGSKELSFGSHNDNCTFDIILKVIQETKDKDMTKEKLRSILSDEYVKLFNKDNKKIMKGINR